MIVHVAITVRYHEFYYEASVCITPLVEETVKTALNSSSYVSSLGCSLDSKQQYIHNWVTSSFISDAACWTERGGLNYI